MNDSSSYPLTAQEVEIERNKLKNGRTKKVKKTRKIKVRKQKSATEEAYDQYKGKQKLNAYSDQDSDQQQEEIQSYKLQQQMQRQNETTQKPAKKQTVLQRTMQAKTNTEAEFDLDYLASSDDEEQQIGHFKNLSHNEKRNKILRLWRTVWNNTQALVVFLRLKDVVITKISLFGRQLLAEQLNSRTVKEQKTCPFIIMPQSKFKFSWSILIIFLLTYSCVYVPVEVAFLDFEIDGPAYKLDKTIGLTVDFLFFCDIVINFISAYEIPGSNSFEVRLSVLAKEYVLSWFFIDLVACLPVDIFEAIINQLSSNQDPDSARYAKLARLPRIYRVIRIVRLFKILKLFKYHKGIKRQITKLKLNSGTTRVIKFILVAMFAVHVMACVWFMQARLRDFDPDTWVYNMGKVDEKWFYQYFYSMYWAFQTLTTVGYGDFGANNIVEYLINIFWMISGVVFYSILVASVTSNIAAETSVKDNLTSTLKALEDFAKEQGLDPELSQKIRQFLLNNQEDLFSKVEEEKLLNELPISLKEEVLYYQHGFLVDSIKMLQESEENEFVWALVQQTQKIIYEKDDPIYWQGDFAENFYLLEIGKVKLFAQNGFSFITYKEGDIFGDSDAVLGELRDCKAAASMDCTLHSLKIESIAELLNQFPEVHEKMKKDAKEKRLRHAKKIAQCEKKFPVYGFGDINNQQTIDRLQKMGLIVNVATGKNGNKKSTNTMADLLPLFDEVDVNFDKDKLTPQVADELRNFILKKTESQDIGVNKDATYSQDVYGALSILHRRMKDINKGNPEAIVSEIRKILNKLEILRKAHPLSDDRAIEQTDSYYSPRKRLNSQITTNLGPAGSEVDEEKEFTPAIVDDLKHLIEIQRLVEEDENLGVPEAQATLEVLYYFNQDAAILTNKMNQLYEMVNYFKEQSEAFVGQTRVLEQQTVGIQERQLNLEANTDILLSCLEQEQHRPQFQYQNDGYR